MRLCKKVASAVRPISPPSASISRTRWPFAVPPIDGLQGSFPPPSILMVNTTVLTAESAPRPAPPQCPHVPRRSPRRHMFRPDRSNWVPPLSFSKDFGRIRQPEAPRCTLFVFQQLFFRDRLSKNSRFPPQMRRKARYFFIHCNHRVLSDPLSPFFAQHARDSVFCPACFPLFCAMALAGFRPFSLSAFSQRFFARCAARVLADAEAAAKTWSTTASVARSPVSSNRAETAPSTETVTASSVHAGALRIQRLLHAIPRTPRRVALPLGEQNPARRVRFIRLQQGRDRLFQLPPSHGRTALKYIQFV